MAGRTRRYDDYFDQVTATILETILLDLERELVFPRKDSHKYNLFKCQVCIARSRRRLRTLPTDGS